MNTETYWVGSREHLPLSVLDGTTDVTTYDVAIVDAGASLTAATWKPSTVYDGERGVWIENLPVGSFSVFARAGGGDPNEQAIVLCGYVCIRNTY